MLCKGVVGFSFYSHMFWVWDNVEKCDRGSWLCHTSQEANIPKHKVARDSHPSQSHSTGAFFSNWDPLLSSLLSYEHIHKSIQHWWAQHSRCLATQWHPQPGVKLSTQEPSGLCYTQLIIKRTIYTINIYCVLSGKWGGFK